MPSFLSTLSITFLIHSNALQIFNTDSVDQYRDGIISCNGNEDCQIICDQTNGCKNALINCPNGYLCDITCSATKACDNSTIIATYSTSLTINNCADGFFTCKGLTIYLPPNRNGIPIATINGADNGLSQGAGVNNRWDAEPINPMQFYAIYGWKDINIINYSGDYQYHGGTMHCTIGYDIFCPFNNNSWSCQNTADICNNPPTLSPTDSPTTITSTPTTRSPTVVTPITSTITTSQSITSTLHPTVAPLTNIPSTIAPSSQVPTTSMPTSSSTTNIPTISPSTQSPTTTLIPTVLPSVSPTTDIPTIYPTTQSPTTSIPTTTTDPTSNPTTQSPTTSIPTTSIPTTTDPTSNPSTQSPSTSIPTVLPSVSPTTNIPTTTLPTVSSSTSNPTLYPSTKPPSTQSPTTSIMSTITTSTSNPTIHPSTASPTTSIFPTISPSSYHPTSSPIKVTESDESDSTTISHESGLKSGGNSNIPSFLKSIHEMWYIVASIALCLCCFTLILTYYIIRTHRLQIQLTAKFASTLHSIPTDSIILAQKSSNSTSMTPSNTLHNTQNNNNPLHTVSPIAEGDDDGIYIQYDIIQKGDAFNDHKLNNKLPDIEMGQFRKMSSTKLYKARSVSITDKIQSNDPISYDVNSPNHSKSGQESINTPELMSIASAPQSIHSMDVDDIEFTKSGTEVNFTQSPSNHMSYHPVLDTQQRTLRSIEEHKMYHASIYGISTVQPAVSVSMYQSPPIQHTASQQVISRSMYQASTMPNMSQNVPSIQQPVVSRPIYRSAAIQNVSLHPVPQSYPVTNPNINELRLSVPVQESMSNIPTIATPDSVLTELTGVTSTEYMSDRSDGDISSDNKSDANSECSSTSTTTSSSSSSSSSCTATDDMEQEKANTFPPRTSDVDIPKSDMLSIPRNDNQTMIVISASIEELMSDNSNHNKMQSSLWTVTEDHSKKCKSVTEIKTPDFNLGTVGDVYGDMFGVKNTLSITDDDDDDDDQIDSSILLEDDNENKDDKYAD